jgi:hypothetical protein
MRELAEIRAALEEQEIEKQKKFEELKQRQVEARAEWIARRKEKQVRKELDQAEDVRLAKEWTAMVNKREQDRIDAYARIYEKQKLRQKQYASSSGAEEKRKFEEEAAKIAKWQELKDKADQEEADRRARKRRDAQEDINRTIERQLREKAERKKKLQEDDKKYGELYVEEAKQALLDEDEKQRKLMEKNLKYQAELMEHSRLVLEEKEKKSVSMTQLERSLNRDMLDRVLSSPELFQKLKKRVEKAGV